MHVDFKSLSKGSLFFDALPHTGLLRRYPDQLNGQYHIIIVENRQSRPLVITSFIPTVRLINVFEN